MVKIFLIIATSSRETPAIAPSHRDALEKIEPDRQLHLAVRVSIYESFFQRRFIVAAVKQYQLRLVIYDVKQEVIVQWL
jgi:hypothetical protein